MKKLIIFFLVSIFGLTFLFSQSLVEIAKQEQERRAKLKGKTAKVVTNADLAKIKKAPALVVISSEAPPGERIEGGEAKTEEPDYAETTYQPRRGQVQSSPMNPKYAARVMSSTFQVRNPEFALDRPDGKYAEIAYYGILDLELEATNGPGDDIAVYAQRHDVGILPETLNCGVFVMGRDEDWIYIGTVGGLRSPEKFDLGEVRSST